MALVDCFVGFGVNLLLGYIAVLFIGYTIFIYDVQILAPCLEMERLEIGLEHLKGTRAQCGVAAWIRMLYALHLAQRTSLRMHIKPFLIIYIMHLDSWYITFWVCLFPGKIEGNKLGRKNSRTEKARENKLWF